MRSNVLRKEMGTVTKHDTVDDRLFRTILENRKNVFFIVLDVAQQQFSYVSPSFEHMTGCSIDEAKTTFPERFPTANQLDQEFIYDGIQKVASGAYEQLTLDYQMVHRPEQARVFNITIKPLSDTGAIEQLVIEGSDVTEKRFLDESIQQQAQQLFDANKMNCVASLISGIAHEINNPNNSIMLNASFLNEIWHDAIALLDDYAEKYKGLTLKNIPYDKVRSEFSKLLERIVDSSERIKAIVDNMRYFLHKDNDEFFSRLDFNKVVEAAVSITTYVIKKKTPHFVVEYSQEALAVSGNPQALELAIINILNNAWQAIDTKGTISLKTFANQESCFIEISDSGKGMTEEDIQQAFNPFFTTKNNSQNRGLGLTIARQVIKSHRGTISIDSSTPQGTVVLITLPKAGHN